MNGFKRAIAYVCAVLLMLTVSTDTGVAVSADSLSTAQEWYKEGSYGAYLQSHAEAPRPDTCIRVTADGVQVSPSLTLPETLPACDSHVGDHGGAGGVVCAGGVLLSGGEKRADH